MYFRYGVCVYCVWVYCVQACCVLIQSSIGSNYITHIFSNGAYRIIGYLYRCDGPDLNGRGWNMIVNWII